MIKVVFTAIMMFSLACGVGLKPTGCELSQVGDVKLSLGKTLSLSKVDYKPIAKSGRNFRAILVGSVLSIGDTKVKILDIKANKRVGRQPRTGVVSVFLKTSSKSEKIDMKYRYNKGHFEAKGLQKNSNEISFTLEIKALLCHAK